MDETYIKVKGIWKYLYRAVDKEGKIVDFLLTAHRDMAAARRFFEKAMRENGAPEKIAIDKSGANKAAIDEINGAMAAPITVCQVKYLNNIVEQDHRAIQRVTRPMLGFESFRAAATLSLVYRRCLEWLREGNHLKSCFADVRLVYRRYILKKYSIKSWASRTFFALQHVFTV